MGVLKDIDTSCHSMGEKGTDKRVLLALKNTMSDCSIVQKNFNQLLEDYRGQVLPEVMAGWKDLTSGV